MPNFGHNLSLTGVQKVDGYSEVDPWSWHPQQSNNSSQTYQNIFDPSLYANFAPHAPESVHPRHHSLAASHVVAPPVAEQVHNSTPPQPRQNPGSSVKAQPAFKPTWRGFLDSTKDAMTIVEAALQGRLSHISRRPHDKERAEMLTSGTVLVYEENASGIKRWTDAVHWSPSRVMNNCLIYRQLVRALKPEEKKAALNPSCGGKRKRKESASPCVTNTGDNVNKLEDEYDNPIFDGGVAGDVTPTSEPPAKVYANFAQSLTPEQQRRYCGSLVDSYEFKEGGLMKKTISVKYQGTHHHIISYYSLEDVVSGKLKRPFQDPNLAGIQPRPELLTGWKVSLEDEESKEMPLVAGYSQQLQPSHIQHQVVGPYTQGMAPQGIVQSHTPLHLQMSAEYWQGAQVPHHPSQHTPSHYGHTASPYTTQQTTQHYPQQPSAQQYSSQQSSTSQYIPDQQSTSTQQYPAQNTVQQYPQQQHTSQQYPPSHHAQPPQQTQYALPQVQVFDVPVHASESQPSIQRQTQSPVQQQDPQRRASAPVQMQTYGQPQPQYQHPAPSHTQSYYRNDHTYSTEHSYGY
ncbi:hypothetical protein K469DRAFT_588531 [Zopfia rhizophila CBS 207.26]|uniref:Camp independent regulatory protein n=1 Tax=Zopfia rhizophila CBS 207.26 TaxID=1314779 RepID=A0A6A6DVW8_9PEZI|nr:hypothetical protein K469DRAFT_588531 [Zopfia rhizophila CBS 207.26]